MELRETLTCALACVLFTGGMFYLGCIGQPISDVFIFAEFAIASGFGAGWGFSKLVNKGDKK